MTRPVLDQWRPFPYVLMYHSVAVRSQDPYLVTVGPARFEAQLRWLRTSGHRGVSMRELLTAWHRGRAQGLVGLTFDDGYADFVQTVLPALVRHGHTATVFVLAGRIGGDNRWEFDGPRKPLLTADQIRCAASSGMEIGSHGMYHRRLSELPGAALREEVSASRMALRELCGQEINGFCYPYGDVTGTVIESVRRSGYDYGCAIWRSELSGRHALPRTYVGNGDRIPHLFAKRLRHALYDLPRREILRFR